MLYLFTGKLVRKCGNFCDRCLCTGRVSLGAFYHGSRYQSTVWLSRDRLGTCWMAPDPRLGFWGYGHRVGGGVSPTRHRQEVGGHLDRSRCKLPCSGRMAGQGIIICHPTCVTKPVSPQQCVTKTDPPPSWGRHLPRLTLTIQTTHNKHIETGFNAPTTDRLIPLNIN